MANSNLPNVPSRSQALDQNGLFTQVWIGWFNQLFTRTGGNTAPSLSSIYSALSALQTDVSTLETEVSGLETTVTTQGVDISVLEDAVNGLNVEPAT